MCTAGSSTVSGERPSLKSPSKTCGCLLEADLSSFLSRGTTDDATGGVQRPSRAGYSWSKKQLTFLCNLVRLSSDNLGDHLVQSWCRHAEARCEAE